MRALRLIKAFMRASFLEESAYRANFLISVLTALLNFGSGILAIFILFQQIDAINGWTQATTLAILGVYQVVSALRGLFIGPGLDSLAGMTGDVWSGTLDFTLMRPVNTQFLVSVRKWQLFELFNLSLGVGILVAAGIAMQSVLSLVDILAFLAALGIGLILIYAILLIFAALVFWSPGIMFTWIFDAIFQLARYPLSLYPSWLRWILTWIFPVGIVTTLPAQALTQTLTAGQLGIGAGIALLLVIGASLLFRTGLRRYASASS